MNDKQKIATLRDALEECAVYFDNYADTIDGDDGIPEPNEELILLNMVQRTLDETN